MHVTDLLDSNPGAPAHRDELRKADVIVGVDETTGEPCGVFAGYQTLARVAYGEMSVEGVQEPHSESGSLIEVRIDPETEQLEFLVAACLTLRGSCDYEAWQSGGKKRA